MRIRYAYALFSLQKNVKREPKILARVIFIVCNIPFYIGQG